MTRFVTDRDVSELAFPVSPELKRQYLDAFARTPGADAAVTRATSAAGQETEVEALVRRAEAVLVRLDEATKCQARRALWAWSATTCISGSARWAWCGEARCRPCSAVIR